jgi:peptide chain release factor 1
VQYSDRLDEAEVRYNELTTKMADPEVISDSDQYRKVTKAQSELAELVSKYREWKRASQELADARQMLAETDPDLKQMAEMEVTRLEPEITQIETDLQFMLLPKDPNDEKNVVLEIRKGAGGDEASLFAAEVFRMYSRYAEEMRWKVEITSLSESSVGGLSEVIALISGNKVYSRLKWESGVHRVQRVPQTETQGRVHTSTITVVVMPEADEVDVQLDPKDIRVDTFCSSGPGGQSVNTTYSAIRLTHLPTNTVVSCQDEKVPNQEQSQGYAGPAFPPLSNGDGKADGRARSGAQRHDRHRRPQRKNPHLQFSAEPNHGPPHRPHPPPARPDHGRPSRTGD